MPGRVLVLTLDALDFIDHAINWIILTSRPRIADQRENRDGLTDIGYVEARIMGFQCLQNGQRGKASSGAEGGRGGGQ